jgi:spore maturation protein SpmB
VNIKNSRYLVPVCLIADCFGIVVAIIVARAFF